VTDPKAALLPTFNTVGDIVRIFVFIPTRTSSSNTQGIG
jgi:hypothetical protein